jgi:putative oxidoreductase
LTRTDRALQLVLAIAFAAAGIFKIVDPQAFAFSVARVAPIAVVGPVAILIPWIEVVAAVALFLPKFRGAALKLILGMLVVFTGVLAVALVRGKAGACGCFGSADGLLSRMDLALARNVVLIALAVIWFRRKPTSPAGPASPASDTGR